MIEKTIKSGSAEMGFSVPTIVISQLKLYAAELLKWNRKINLTAITGEKEMAIKHFLDALYLVTYISDGESVLDVGSGAGIPAIPLKIAKPGVKVFSVDAVSKKIQFQKHAARILDLDNFEAIHARVENLQDKYSNYFDVITSRAFTSLEQFVKLTSPLLADGGRLIAMKGPASVEEIESSAEVLIGLGFKISEKIDYDLPQNNGKRCLIVITHCKTK